MKTLLFCALVLATYINTLKANEYSDCVNCHANDVSQWHTSDHYKSMGDMTTDFILGDFTNVTVKHHSQTARFYQIKTDYLVDLTEQGQTKTYRINNTFGHYPLQQYLVSLNNGALQVLPFSWDSRSKEDGGQKWFPAYANEDIKKNDRLHWKQPLFNWNGMCEDCHSDGLKRNYDLTANQFATQFDHINVGCQSCHGKMKSGHDKKSPLRKSIPTGSWQRNHGENVAKWAGEERDNQFMESCFACHSLRSPLLDGIDVKKTFLDQFTPDLLSRSMYFPDGQIKEEVFVYGSFLQSKMHAAGVNCLDCHDKHTMKTKLQGNGLCLQCHNPETYEQVSHTHHDLNTDGGQCVNCHMPERTYMGVDPRRDHSFVIPRPKLSLKFGVPNACTTCHKNNNDQWAATVIEQWGASKNQPSADQLNYLQLQHSGFLPIYDHLKLANSGGLSVIKQANVISLLPNSTNTINEKNIKPWINSHEPLIRLSAARIGYLLPEAERIKSYSILLNDPVKAVRVAAAENLIGMKVNDFSQFKIALQELIDANDINSWRGEGLTNQSILYSKLGKVRETIKSLQKAIEIDPYFSPAYVNLAEQFRIQNNVKDEKATLVLGVNNNPDSGALHYAMGMHLIRTKNAIDAVTSFDKAKQLEEDNLQYAYLYFLSLDNIGKTKQALQAIKASLLKYSNDSQLIELGLSFSKKLMDRQSYLYLLEQKRKSK